MAILAPVYSVFLKVRLIGFSVVRMERKLERQINEVKAATSVDETAKWDELGFAMDGIQLTIEEGLAKISRGAKTNSDGRKALATENVEGAFGLIAEYLRQPGESLLISGRDGLQKLRQVLAPSTFEMVRVYDITDSSTTPLFEVGRYNNIVVWLDSTEQESNYCRKVPFSWISETANLYFGPSARKAENCIDSISYGTPVRVAFGHPQSDIYPASIVRSLEG
ncbi:hypothetical protein [Corynebacterium aurimucosum]